MARDSKSNLLEELKALLQKDKRFIAEEKLLKNTIIEHALKLDKDLVRRLLSKKRIKAYFFVEVDEVQVFDKDKFISFVDNKQFLPDSYTAFKNKIGLTLDGKDDYLKERKDVVLVWPYKDCVLEGGQTKEDQKRDEIFWNETLAPDEIDRLFEPKVLTNFKRFDKAGKHKVSEIKDTDNLIIKGNNLLTLYTLKKRFAGAVKLIYIDPPYNADTDALYNDSFRHSSWLTLMKNRLEAARELLQPEGLILIQIDNRELAYLRVLCDGVFNRDNFRNSIIVKKGTKSLQKQFNKIQQLNAGYDTILFYSKNKSTKIPNLFKTLGKHSASSWNNHWRGTDRHTMRYELFGTTPKTGQWRWSENRTLRAVKNYESLLSYIKLNKEKNEVINNDLIDKYYSLFLEEHNITSLKEFELVRLSKKGKPEHYIPARIKILLSENWMDLSVAGRVTDFQHEKNEEILQRMIEWLTEENDIVLDFVLGSGTTATVAHKLKRRYFGIEQINSQIEIAIKRLHNVIKGNKDGISKAVNWQGGGDFVYCELMKWNEAYIDKIRKAKTKAGLAKIWQVMREKAHLSYKLDFKEFDKNAAEF